MTKRKADLPMQLSFEFTMNAPPPDVPPAKESSPIVVISFVDASTLAIRKAAFRRVKASRIFSVPYVEKQAL